MRNFLCDVTKGTFAATEHLPYVFASLITVVAFASAELQPLADVAYGRGIVGKSAVVGDAQNNKTVARTFHSLAAAKSTALAAAATTTTPIAIAVPNAKDFDFVPLMQPIVKLFTSYSHDDRANANANANSLPASANLPPGAASLAGDYWLASANSPPNANKLAQQRMAGVAGAAAAAPRRRDGDDTFFDAKSLMRKILGIATTTTTTQRPPASELLMQTLFEPIIDSIESEIRKAKMRAAPRNALSRDGTKTHAISAPHDAPQFNADHSPHHHHYHHYDRYAGDGGRASPSTDYYEGGENDVNGGGGAAAADFPRRAPSSPPSLRHSALMRKMARSADAATDVAAPAAVDFPLPAEAAVNAPRSEEAAAAASPALATLLQFMGVDARPRADQVRVGRDRSVSVLGMPVGRRDGLSLSPLTGVSVGNQDMFGPVAVNDRYSVKWDFLDKLQNIFDPQPPPPPPSTQLARLFHWA